ncbi:RING-type domain-containing protein [Chloropicon primus]|nr:RING-type domain-containing protein [Chloropicon primus]
MMEEVEAKPPEGEARTEKKLFGGAETEEDADLALARVLQEQERELFFIAQQQSLSFGKGPAGDSGEGLAFQERSVNSLQDDSDDSDLNDEQFAARLQAEEMHRRFYYENSSGPESPLGEFAENAPQGTKPADEAPEDFTYEDLTTLGDSVGTVKLGLSQEKLNSMRKVQYSAESAEYTDEKCAICQVEFEEGEDVLLLPCKHLYHNPCIEPWLAGNKNCPVCKHELED